MGPEALGCTPPTCVLGGMLTTCTQLVCSRCSHPHSHIPCRWDWGLPPWSTLSPPPWLPVTSPAPWPSSLLPSG